MHPNLASGRGLLAGGRADVLGGLLRRDERLLQDPLPLPVLEPLPEHVQLVFVPQLALDPVTVV